MWKAFPTGLNHRNSKPSPGGALVRMNDKIGIKLTFLFVHILYSIVIVIGFMYWLGCLYLRICGQHIVCLWCGDFYSNGFIIDLILYLILVIGCWVDCIYIRIVANDWVVCGLLSVANPESYSVVCWQ